MHSNLDILATDRNNQRKKMIYLLLNLRDLYNFALLRETSESWVRKFG